MLLDAWWSHVHAENDVLGFGHGQTCNVDIVFLGVVCKNQVLELNLNMNPLLVSQSRPDVMWLSHHTLVRSQDDLRSLWMQVEGTQDQNEPAEASETLDAFLPIIVKVEQEHLWLRGFEDPVAELLDLETSLERELQLAAFNHDVREIEQMHLEWVKHAFACHNDLLRLLLDRQTANQSCHFLSCLPLGELAEAFLSSPDTRVDDFEEQLARLGVENEDRSINWLRRQVALKSLVNSDSVHICVINEPNYLVGEEFSVVL